LQLAAPPTAAGIMYLVAIPLGSMYGDVFDNFVSSPTRITAFPHVRVVLGAANDYTLKLPFLGLTSAFVHTSTGGDSEDSQYTQMMRAGIGYRLALVNLTSPFNVGGGTVNVSVKLSVRLVNPRIRVPTLRGYFVPEMEKYDMWPGDNNNTADGRDYAEALPGASVPMAQGGEQAVKFETTMIDQFDSTKSVVPTRLATPNYQPTLTDVIIGDEWTSVLHLLHSGQTYLYNFTPGYALWRLNTAGTNVYPTGFEPTETIVAGVEMQLPLFPLQNPAATFYAPFWTFLSKAYTLFRGSAEYHLQPLSDGSAGMTVAGNITRANTVAIGASVLTGVQQQSAPVFQTAIVSLNPHAAVDRGDFTTSAVEATITGDAFVDNAGNKSTIFSRLDAGGTAANFVWSRGLSVRIPYYWPHNYMFLENTSISAGTVTAYKLQYQPQANATIFGQVSPFSTWTLDTTNAANRPTVDGTKGMGAVFVPPPVRVTYNLGDDAVLAVLRPIVCVRAPTDFITQMNLLFDDAWYTNAPF